ncbi:MULTISPECIES: hypothetical protein [Methylobacterium]|uniref:hypothetical protein n=1 Tax=Methylobacterium TaxID=407 RepID=UPI000FE13F5E|nr:MULTISPECIES: hypothetical protein [Methylobacterium]MBN4098372.1 hypothetical protein [Methylobacterium sp. OT2]UIN36859.1 hypothetical protein LXM90_10315 [Methylobacterium oryzae]
MTATHQRDHDGSSTLQHLVTVLVTAQLGRATEDRVDIITRLQHLEQAAWTTGADRQTLQVITSGRRLLGDASDLTPDVLKRQSARKARADHSRYLRRA